MEARLWETLFSTALLNAGRSEAEVSVIHFPSRQRLTDRRGQPGCGVEARPPAARRSRAGGFRAHGAPGLSACHPRRGCRLHARTPPEGPGNRWPCTT